MDGLLNWINEYQTLIKTVGSAVIVLVALAILAFLLVKAIAEARKARMNGVMKFVGFALIVVLIALVGIGGIIKLVDKIAPNDSVLPQDGTAPIAAVEYVGTIDTYSFV